MGLAPGASRSASRELRAGPRTPAEARLFLSKVIESFGVGVDRATAILLTSELASNAARHGKEPIEINVSMEEEGFLVSVFDRGAGFHPEDLRFDGGSSKDPWEEGGWGLPVVHNLSSEWGVKSRDDGTEVWFRL